MKKILLIGAMILSLTGLVGYAGAATIGFEEFSSGTIVSGPGLFDDVVFTAGPNDVIKVSANVPGPDLTGEKTAQSVPFTHDFPFRADFLIPGVYSVSVAMGDFNADTDNLFLRAYSVTGTLLDEVLFELLSNIYGGPTLSVSGSNIAYVLFGSTGDNPNSVYFDNFTYEATQAVPEPLSVLLFGLGLIGLAGVGRKLKK